jgi:hypothetical protein
MQFKHPEILYALFLLIIPIIVHLFQLRKFQKVPFTNVQFLKRIELKTRKSSKLKKLLVLFSRLLLFTSLIFAFAQPYFSKLKNSSVQDTFIYIDNSLSMQAKGERGELLKRAVQDIIENNKDPENIHLITNDNEWYNLNTKELKNILVSLDYYPIKQDLKAILFKINSKTKNSNTSKSILISDFQKLNINYDFQKDTSSNFNFVQIAPIKKSNISIDSVYISNLNNETISLKALVRSHNTKAQKNPISLYNDAILIGKSTIDITENNTTEVEFSIPFSGTINGRVSIVDDDLSFDNELYFVINKTDKINVLTIGSTNEFLSKIYTNDEFNFDESSLKNLDYNLLKNQDLIILNELQNIPNSLIKSLSDAISNGINLVIIPNSNINIASYNGLFRNLNIGVVNSKNENELTITDINFSHPFFQNVFEKQVKNFQYPKVNNYYQSTLKNSSPLIKFENETNFISQLKTRNNTIYWLASAINTDNSNFKNSPLIVPIFYNFGKYSYKKSQLNYLIGRTNEIEVKVTLQKDNILEFSSTNESFIPLQQVGNSSVIITTTNQPLVSGIYSIKNNEKLLKNIAYNYNREESDLEYLNLEELIKQNSNYTYFTNVKDAFNAINEENKTNNLWHLFLVISLVFVVIEILLLKFLKS